jgi:phosphomannomutase
MNLPERIISMHDLMATSGVRFGTSGARGLVSEMTDEVCFAYTLAFLKVISAKSGSHVALSMDLRPSSPSIVAACAAAIEYVGLKVDFCGAIPTPALAFYAQQKNIPGLMVTGSHIPFDRNGIKFYGTLGEITKDDEVNISQTIVNLPQVSHSIALPSINPTARQMYINRYLDYFEPRCLSGMRLGFYEHSSVARDLLSEILETLGAKVISLGRTNEFTPIDTEAIADVDIKRARKWSKENGLDAILSTDGDADRPLIGDELGQWMRGDIVGLLCARYLGAQAVAIPVSCNSAIEKCGAFVKVERTRIGSPYVIEAMAKLRESGSQNIVGFEANGGFLLESSLVKNGHVLAPLKTRDAVLPILSILAMSKDNGCKVSELLQDLPARFTASDRLQFFPTDISHHLLINLADSIPAMNKLLKSLRVTVASLNQTDGLRITLDNGEIVHFRPSGNAPELRCYAEASSQKRAETLARIALRLIRKKL